MGRIFVCGDIHHENDIAKIQPQNFTIQQDLTKEDVLIVAGDWGGERISTNQRFFNFKRKIF